MRCFGPILQFELRLILPVSSGICFVVVLVVPPSQKVKSHLVYFPIDDFSMCESITWVIYLDLETPLCLRFNQNKSVALGRAMLVKIAQILSDIYGPQEMNPEDLVFP